MADANGYMEKRDYDILQNAADWLNNCESDLAELRNRFHALYPDNSYSVNQPDFEEAVNAFEQSQKLLIQAMDALLP